MVKAEIWHFIIIVQIEIDDSDRTGDPRLLKRAHYPRCLDRTFKNRTYIWDFVRVKLFKASVLCCCPSCTMHPDGCISRWSLSRRNNGHYRGFWGLTDDSCSGTRLFMRSQVERSLYMVLHCSLSRAIRGWNRSLYRPSVHSCSFCTPYSRGTPEPCRRQVDSGISAHPCFYRIPSCTCAGRPCITDVQSYPEKYLQGALLRNRPFCWYQSGHLYPSVQEACT